MGDPEAHCREVIGQLYLFLDDELEEPDCALLRHHIERCVSCEGLVTFERQLLFVIKTKCSERSVPEGLEGRLRAELRKLL